MSSQKPGVKPLRRNAFPQSPAFATYFHFYQRTTALLFIYFFFFYQKNIDIGRA